MRDAVRRLVVRRAVANSMLGPLELTTSAEGIVRRNTTGERRVAWSDIRAATASPGLLSLRGHRRAVLIPIGPGRQACPRRSCVAESRRFPGER